MHARMLQIYFTCTCTCKFRFACTTTVTMHAHYYKLPPSFTVSACGEHTSLNCSVFLPLVSTICTLTSGTVGYIGTSLFVRKIYATVKIDWTLPHDIGMIFCSIVAQKFVMSEQFLSLLVWFVYVYTCCKVDHNYDFTSCDSLIIARILAMVTGSAFGQTCIWPLRGTYYMKEGEPEMEARWIILL